MFTISYQLENMMLIRFRALQLLAFFFAFKKVTCTRSSSGCGQVPPISPGEIRGLEFIYRDKNLGPLWRKYIMQVPPGYDENEPSLLIFDLHGYTGSAEGQVGSPWRPIAKRENALLVWPDGMHDSPHHLGSWNCSNSNGPKGAPCDMDRANWKKFECYASCPLCNELTTCDWTSCADDIGFIDYVQQEVLNNFCVDMDQMHISGMSNGGIFSYFLASYATDALGFASIAPMASSALLGFGSPPQGIDIPISIIDMHGLKDKLIPNNEESSVDNGPMGSLLSVWGWYFEKKATLLAEWRNAMQCDQDSLPYPTIYDGIDNFECQIWHCKNGQDVVSCTGDFAHEYPLHGNHFASTEIAFRFIKEHPRRK